MMLDLIPFVEYNAQKLGWEAYISLHLPYEGG